MADTLCCSERIVEPEHQIISKLQEKEDELEAERRQMGKLNIGGKMPGKAGKFTDPSTIIPPANLAELISRLHEIFESDDVCVEYVRELMASYPSNREEWKKFAKFDPYKYTRNLIDQGNGKFNLMLLCWNEGQGSSIHSHADSHCFLKILSGSIKEELFNWPQKCASATCACTNEDSRYYNCCEELDEVRDDILMRKKEEMQFSKNECTYINDSIGLHRVENDSHVEKAVTLHLYSPPFEECMCFDQRSGRVSTSRMTFWSKFGKRTPFGKDLETARECVMEDN